MAKFVRYGPSDRYGMPKAGFSASSFALIWSGRKFFLGVALELRRQSGIVFVSWAPSPQRGRFDALK